MKKIRIVFEALLPGIISFIVALRFNWKWPVMVLLFIILGGFSNFVIIKTLGKEKKEISPRGYMICSGILIISGLLISGLGLIVNYNELFIVLGIAILSIGIAFLITRLFVKLLKLLK